MRFSLQIISDECDAEMLSSVVKNLVFTFFSIFYHMGLLFFEYASTALCECLFLHNRNVQFATAVEITAIFAFQQPP